MHYKQHAQKHYSGRTISHDLVLHLHLIMRSVIQS